MTEAEIRSQLSALEKAVEAGSPNASAQLMQIKIALTKLSALQPGAVITKENLSEIALARDVYEVAALLSVKQKDETSFERHVSQAKTYYVDYEKTVAKSPRQTLILGLNLIRLMAQNRIAEFHTELELIPAASRSDTYIDYALRLEHYQMEGSYSKMREERTKIPHPSFDYFVHQLMDTVREEVAACCERAYERLPVGSVAAMLSLPGADDEIDAFCEARGWSVRDGVVTFGQRDDGAVTMENLPSGELIKRSLEYAKELEQII